MDKARRARTKCGRIVMDAKERFAG